MLLKIDKGVHHLYIGLVIMGVSYAISPYTTWSIYTYVIGCIIALDDTIQHRIQTWDPSYHSPLHNLYGKTLYRIPLIQKLNIFVDSLFGRK